MDWIVSHQINAAIDGALNFVTNSSVVVFVFVFFCEEVTNIATAADMVYFTEVKQLFPCRVLTHLKTAETFSGFVVRPFDTCFIVIVYVKGRGEKMG